MKRALVSAIGALSLLARLGWQRTRGDQPADPHRRRRWLFSITVVLLGMGLVGIVLLVSGAVPIKASAGHWPPTVWVLQFAKRRSIASHTLGAAAPDLRAAWLVLKGAGHYESGCRPCHGSPDLPHPRVAWAMLPPPPYLADRVHAWDPEELFYIVKHGIKFTGMPAWPALQRDDEVTAMVAFLLEFPKLDAVGYRALVFGDQAPRRDAAPLRDLPGSAPQVAAASCARCHGADGHGRQVAAFPKLAGQREAYLTASLLAYASGDRASGIMQPIAAGLGQEEMRHLARHYAELPRSSDEGGTGSSGDETLRARGRDIAARGIPSRRVPSCSDCHGPGRAQRNPTYPQLAGQFADYLVLQLELFKSGHRGGTKYARIMRRVASTLRTEDMRAVGLYYASLASEARAEAPP